MHGSVKFFVSYEKFATWKIEEVLNQRILPRQCKSVHKELARARKQNDESYHEYMYRMMEIASHADIELEAKIQYIIEGIPDESLNKTILYGAQSISDLRKLLMQYEIIKNSQKTSQRNQSMKPGKKMRREVPRTQDVKSADFRRCHNCGERNHKAAEYSFKNKGTKCFQCREIGYSSQL